MAKHSKASRHRPASFRFELDIPAGCHERFLDATPCGAALVDEYALDYAGFSDLVAPYDIKRWAPQHFVILITLAGQGVLMREGREVPLEPGSLWMLPIHVDHHYFCREPWKLLWFSPSDTPFWRELLGTQVRCLQARHGARMMELARRCHDDMADSDPVVQEACGGYFRLLMHFLHHEFRGTESLLDLEWRRRIDAMWRQVHANPSAWTVERCAQVAGCSRAHLHQLCQRLYACSARERLQQARLLRAVEYLTHTHWGLQEIAARVGYADAFSFSKAFKRGMGRAPAFYRRKAASQP
jgi:AraC-like DNA-binding protein